jgi:predicted nucleic acid-binding protein
MLRFHFQSSSTLADGGKAKIALFSGKVSFITTEHTTWEVKKYIPEIASQSGIPESELFYAFDRFPIVSMPPVVYDENRKQAEELIAQRDPKDVDILALALKFNTTLRTNDKDFASIKEIPILTTADMLKKLAAQTD